MAQGMHFRLDMSGLQDVKRRAPGEVARVIQKLAQDMEGDVKMNFSDTAPEASAPGSPPAVQSGNLKNSIVAVPEGPMTWIVGVGAGAEYGIHLEYGTSRMAARPFMLPSFERIVNMAPQIIRDNMRL